MKHLIKQLSIIVTLFFTAPLAHADFSDWRLLGLGDVNIHDDKSFTLSVPSLDHSKGLIFLSDTVFPNDYHLSFEFKTSHADGVIVMLLALSNLQGDIIVVPDEYDGNWAYFKDGHDHQAYAIALHTHAHQPNTFIRKIPAFDLLAQTHDPFSTTGSTQWHKLNIEKNSGNIKIIGNNEQLLLEVNDYLGDVLEQGHLGFRLSPAAEQSFDVTFRNVQLIEKINL